MLIPPDVAEKGDPEREGGGGPDGPYGLLPGIIIPAEDILEPIGPPIRELDGICERERKKRNFSNGVHYLENWHGGVFLFLLFTIGLGHLSGH
jgi:hypothetical protein